MGDWLRIVQANVICASSNLEAVEKAGFKKRGCTRHGMVERLGQKGPIANKMGLLMKKEKFNDR